MAENTFLVLEEIRTSPTVEAWVYLIRLAINGALDGYIATRFGSIEDLMLTSIENSLEKAAAEAHFHRGLEQVVSSWNPAAASAGNTEAMLRLLQTFRPPSGFLRLLGYMMEGGGFTPFEFETDNGGLPYLEALAWNTLKAYFSLPPKEPSAFPAYDTYVRFLIGSLEDSSTRALACIRLLELGDIKPDSSRLRDLIVLYAKSLVPALVEWLLESDRKDQSAFLTSLYLHCQDSKEARISFDIALERLGGRVELKSHRAVIIRRDEQIISIPFVEGGLYELQKSKEWQDNSDLAVELMQNLTSQEEY